MTKKWHFGFLMMLLFACSNCYSQIGKTSDSSIWNDHNQPDTEPYFSTDENCQHFWGMYNYTAVLHKGFLEENVFEGFLCNYQLFFKKDSAFILNKRKKIIDRGLVECNGNLLTINWKHKEDTKYLTHFTSQDTVELRYLDYQITGYNIDSFNLGLLNTSKMKRVTPAKTILTRPIIEPKKKEIVRKYDYSPFTFFDSCKVVKNHALKNHAKFNVAYPKEWKKRESAFLAFLLEKSDSVSQDRVIINVLPYEDMYFTKNRLIEYDYFNHVQFRNHKGIFLIRSDLKSRKFNYSWRAELKLFNEEKTIVYHLIFRTETNKNAEPNWCKFSFITNSLMLKD